MQPGTLHTICQYITVIGAIIVALAGYGSYHFGKKVEEQKNKVTAIKERNYQNDLEEKEKKIEELQRKAKMAARGVTSTYSFNGTKRETAPGIIKGSVGAEFEAFKQMVKFQEDRNFTGLIELCEQQIKNTPEWFTPYFFRGVAYLNTGKRDEAIADLRYVVDNVGDDPEYKQAKEILVQLEQNP